MRVIKHHFIRVPKDRSKKIEFYDRELFDKSLDHFRGKDACLEISPIDKKRSVPQNRYLFGVVIELLVTETEDFGGWDSYSVYKHLERKFLNDYPIDEPREWVHIKNLSTVDFEELMTKVREWASMEVGCYIPEPHEATVFGEPIITGDWEMAE